MNINILQPKTEPTTGSETGWKSRTVIQALLYGHQLNNTDTPLIWTVSVTRWVPVLIGVTVFYKKLSNIFSYLRRINENRGDILMLQQDRLVPFVTIILLYNSNTNFRTKQSQYLEKYSLRTEALIKQTNLNTKTPAARIFCFRTALKFSTVNS